MTTLVFFLVVHSFFYFLRLCRVKFTSVTAHFKSTYSVYPRQNYYKQLPSLLSYIFCSRSFCNIVIKFHDRNFGYTVSWLGQALYTGQRMNKFRHVIKNIECRANERLGERSIDRRSEISRLCIYNSEVP